MIVIGCIINTCGWWVLRSWKLNKNTAHRVGMCVSGQEPARARANRRRILLCAQSYLQGENFVQVLLNDGEQKEYRKRRYSTNPEQTTDGITQAVLPVAGCTNGCSLMCLVVQWHCMLLTITMVQSRQVGELVGECLADRCVRLPFPIPPWTFPAGLVGTRLRMGWKRNAF